MPTILDIAKRSGVSKSTVSRVLNNHPHVSEASKKKVMEAIQELSYVRNARAVKLRTQKSRMIGIVVPTIDATYFSQLVSAFIQCFRKYNYGIIIHETLFKRENELEMYDKLLHKELDALIITNSLYTEKEIKHKIDDHIVIVCNEQFSGTALDVFGLNEEDAIFEATEFLLDKGCQHIYFCADSMLTPLQQSRWSGFKKAHEHRGLSCPTENRFDGIRTIEDGIVLGNKLFQEGLEVDGIIAGSDFVAAGILHAARLHKIIIPDDLRIIGFDNHPICKTTYPELTSIQNNIEEMVADAVACLTNRMNGESFPPRKKSYRGRMIERHTT
ncbi:LacI family DNA-binding transcriptional regulator [Virgibacillus proomii]|uniref:LacI family DNA-binding transcriptional regulator n=1 Tax=Virgibacillus proomii TaxID=84407 RepID=UPI000984CEEF|nr:LacI family DNA-binding transcriptional regulator [Virgibacillus proomii]